MFRILLVALLTAFSSSQGSLILLNHEKLRDVSSLQFLTNNDLQDVVWVLKLSHVIKILSLR